MNDEPIASLRSSLQFFPTRLPIIELERVEEQIPTERNNETHGFTGR
jgi:hypothetical protein